MIIQNTIGGREPSRAGFIHREDFNNGDDSPLSVLPGVSPADGGD